MRRLARFHRLFWPLVGVAAVLLGGIILDRQEAAAADATGQAAGKPLALHIRKRVETKPGSDRFHALTEKVAWDPAKTAIVVCDMWNQHWCKGATRRVAEMAPRMNEVLTAARKQGVLIIHCPSDTMKYYAGTPQRKLAQQAAPVSTKTPLKTSCNLDKSREGRLPIDDSDGGCDCDPPCKQGSPWTHEIDTLQIAPTDAITDNIEAVYLMRDRKIDNVIVMGVHTNMCVLGRPFSIRQLVYQGLNVVLMRDMTDTMYNSRSAPFVSHFTGTDLVVEHIEKHWCPTIASTDFLGGHEFHFSEDHRPRLAMLIAEPEYKTNRTLPEFAAKELGKDFRVSLIFGSEKDKAEIPGFEAIKDADVLLVSVRRRPLKPEQMKLLHDWVSSGKPVVGIRTACHAFSLRGKEPSPPLGSLGIVGSGRVRRPLRESSCEGRDHLDQSGPGRGCQSDPERGRRRGPRGERSALPGQSAGERRPAAVDRHDPGEKARAGRLDVHSRRRRQVVLYVARPSGRFRGAGVSQAARERTPLGGEQVSQPAERTRLPVDEAS